MKSRHDRLYLYDIIECCDRVADYVNGVREEDYHLNAMLQDALVRNIEVVGEAVKNLAKALNLVEMRGIEPLTSALRTLRSPS